MERVSLFIDFYNFINSSNNYLNQKCFIDYTKIPEYFINKETQVYIKTYIYGGLNFGKMLDFFRASTKNRCYTRRSWTRQQREMH